MLKVHYQSDQEELLKACGGVMYQVFEDRFVKSAASEVFTKEALRNHAPDKDHFMLHLVAMGDQETYSFNKNGDGFPKSSLEKYANTFVTNGCFFREHRNRDQKAQGIGSVKAAAYSPEMHRVELIVHGHREKAASEYAQAKAGKPLSFSMSCRVPYDECSVCGNKAKKQADYCGHLKEGMLKYNDEFKKYAFAINEHPTFFDISAVAKPADRIAHYLDYAFPDEDDRVKAASVARVITGSEWAEYEGVCVPDRASTWSPEKRYILEKLAKFEKYFNDRELFAKEAHEKNPLEYFASHVAPYACMDKMSDEAVEALRKVEPGELCRELSKRATILPFPEFAAWVYGEPRSTILNNKIVKIASSSVSMSILPSIMQSLLSGGPSELDGLFDSSCGHGAAEEDEVQKFMDEAAAKFSIKTEPARQRVIQIITIKMASDNSYPERFVVENLDSISPREKAEATALAEAYGIYKVAAMLDITKAHANEIDDMQYLMAVAQNTFIYR